jgi:hypothetical protein
MSQSGAGSPIGGQPIPTQGKAVSQHYHWWFDRNQTGVFNSSPPSQPMYANSPSGDIGHQSRSYSSSPGTSYGSPSILGNHFPQEKMREGLPDPKVAIPMPAPGEEMKFREYFRRSSLKNMYLLDDFGTPLD